MAKLTFVQKLVSPYPGLPVMDAIDVISLSFTLRPKTNSSENKFFIQTVMATSTGLQVEDFVVVPKVANLASSWPKTAHLLPTSKGKSWGQTGTSGFQSKSCSIYKFHLICCQDYNTGKPPHFKWSLQSIAP